MYVGKCYLVASVDDHDNGMILPQRNVTNITGNYQLECRSKYQVSIHYQLSLCQMNIFPETIVVSYSRQVCDLLKLSG